MHHLSVRYAHTDPYHLLATFPTYATARNSVFDSVALAGGAVYGVHCDPHTGNTEFLTNTSERQVVEYLITTHANLNR